MLMAFASVNKSADVHCTAAVYNCYISLRGPWWVRRMSGVCPKPPHMGTTPACMFAKVA